MDYLRLRFIYWIKRIPERIIMWIVWHAPKQFIYYATIKLGANATTREYSNMNVPSLTFIDALKRWKIV